MVNTHSIVFLLALAVFLLSLAAIAGHYSLQSYKLSHREWKSLLDRLAWIDRESIALIALDIINESGSPRQEEELSDLDPSRIWTLIGGLEGMKVIEENCAVLIDLAFYVQRWHPEALVVAEHLRLSAKEIEWYMGRLRGAAQTGKLETSFPDYAQRAIATYYLMTRHVLTLYEKTSLPGLADLQQSL